MRLPSDMSETGGARRVGILVNRFHDLAGATDFLVSLVDAMCRSADGRELVLIIRSQPPLWSPRRLASTAFKIAKNLKGLRWPKFPANAENPEETIDRLVREGLRRLPLYTVPASNKALEQLCAQQGIDVVLPTHFALSGYRRPWVGYIFDFQHRYYPHFFGAFTRKLRDLQFGRMLRDASTVIVNARQVKIDAESFHAARAKIVPLPFSASPDPRWFDADPVEVRRRYGIGPKYFIISNQFWVHKRHEVAIQAFLQLAEARTDIELVCTGSTNDWRVPDHFARLSEMISSSGFASRVHILGLIPKADQIALLRDSLAVVQPTAFEGGPGGGSVFDAVAFGVRSIVSDLPVNREIEEHVTEYFPLDDIDALAAAMVRVAAMPAAMRVEKDELIRRGEGRRMAMGKVLWAAADHALLHKRGTRTASEG